MPKLSVFFVRTALLYLLLGTTLGLLLLISKAIPQWAAVWRLYEVHVEFLVIGWTLQLVMGVAFWIMPKYSAEPIRGRESLGWAALGFINTGILLKCGAALAFPWPILNALAVALKLVAIVFFVRMMWPRVKAFAL
ncbi:MAG: hypothetical protein KDI06_10795 [Calditrichaeota bacterium]|nr:hypothetical protein [Calditrichota bacterium]